MYASRAGGTKGHSAGRSGHVSWLSHHGTLNVCDALRDCEGVRAKHLDLRWDDGSVCARVCLRAGRLLRPEHGILGKSAKHDGLLIAPRVLPRTRRRGVPHATRRTASAGAGVRTVLAPGLKYIVIEII